jgi:hypothetical protein
VCVCVCVCARIHMNTVDIEAQDRQSVCSRIVRAFVVGL